MSLSEEVSLRLQGCGVLGRTITLKVTNLPFTFSDIFLMIFFWVLFVENIHNTFLQVKRRRIGAGEPSKYMGHGDCENLSHSTTVQSASNDILYHLQLHQFLPFFFW